MSPLAMARDFSVTLAIEYSGDCRVGNHFGPLDQTQELAGHHGRPLRPMQGEGVSSVQPQGRRISNGAQCASGQTEKVL